MENVTLKGFEYRLEFNQVEKMESVRQIPSQGHDGRETAPTFLWSGTLKITHLCSRRETSWEFSTDSFFQTQVPDLTLEDILFLGVNRILFHLEFKSADTRKLFIDKLATEMLLSFYQERQLAVPLRQLGGESSAFAESVLKSWEPLNTYLKRSLAEA